MTIGRKYAPILKWKAGEKNALEKLTDIQKSRITPIIEIIDSEEPQAILKNIVASLPDQTVYLDTFYSEDIDGILLESLLKTSSQNQYNFSPVLLFEDFPLLADRIHNYTNRILVKIPIPEDIEGASYEKTLHGISKWSDGKDIEIDILLDLNFMSDKEQVNIKFSELKSVLKTYINDNPSFSKILIASSSCPDDLSTLVAGDDMFVDRYEFKIFDKIYTNPEYASIKDRLILSDYGVTKFTDSEIDFSKLRYGILPKARYTLNDRYWVLKGKKDRNTRQPIRNHKNIAIDIYNSTHYYKEGFSFGDMEIKEIATLNDRGPGNNTTWVTITANHHIAVVLEQLSKLYET